MGCDFSKDIRFHFSLNNLVSSKLLLSETTSHNFPVKVCHTPRHLLKAALHIFSLQLSPIVAMLTSLGQA